jgi:hypothetical protein
LSRSRALRVDRWDEQDDGRRIRIRPEPYRLDETGHMADIADEQVPTEKGSRASALSGLADERALRPSASTDWLRHLLTPAERVEWDRHALLLPTRTIT